MDDGLQIFTLGGLRILKGRESLTGLGSRKAEALLVYLASTRRPQPREVLADFFWDDRSQGQALANLRAVLTALRHAFGESLIFTREDISINPDSRVWLDTAQMEDGLRVLHLQGSLNASTVFQVEDALRLYQGDFLEGFSLHDCRRFEDWQAQERERLHRLAVDGYFELVSYDIAQRQYQKGIVNASRLLELDPLMEAAHRQMMLLLAHCGQRAAALNQYAACHKQLQDELGVEPAEETHAIYQKIREGCLGGEEWINPLDLLDTQNHNLPASLTRFFGRQVEIAQVKELLSNSRLITLTGAGGVGKTRLALEVGRSLVDGYPNGAWLIELAPLSDPVFIVPTIASVFNINPPSERSLLDFLKSRNFLLVLDNCEHLIGDCAALTEKILKEAPQVYMLATSRELLGIPGEAVFYVPSLTLPDPDQPATVENVQQSEAVCLFLDRARLAMTGYALTADNAASIARVCHRLDGVPLALEMAAANVRMLSAEQIASRLDDAFYLLTGGSRTALPKHQTLRAAIDWSYNLLSELERILFSRLSVFAGGWDLEMAEAICSLSDRSQPSAKNVQSREVFHLLSSLVSKSIVIVEREQGQEARFRLLETIRQYALEKLQGLGEFQEMRSRHLEYFMIWAEKIEPELVGPGELDLFEKIRINLDNIRLALKTGLETDPQSALRLASALFWFWMWNDAPEGSTWLKTCLDRPENAAHSIVRARALEKYVETLVPAYGPLPEKLRWAQECLDLCLEIDDKPGLARVHQIIATFYMDTADLEKAAPHSLASLDLCRGIGDKWWEGRALLGLTKWNLYSGDSSAAKSYLDQAVKIFQELTHRRFWAVCLYIKGGIVGDLDGNLQEAKELLERALELLKAYKQADGMVLSILSLYADQALARGDFQVANEVTGKLVEHYDATEYKFLAWAHHKSQAKILAFQGLYHQAVQLLEQCLDQLPSFSNEVYEMEKYEPIAMMAYSLAHSNQLMRARHLIGNLDKSQTKSILGSLEFPMVLCLLAYLEGNPSEAADLSKEFIKRAVNYKRFIHRLLALEYCAGALQLLGRCRDSVQCLSAAYACRKEHGAPVWPGEQPFHDRVRSSLLAELGEAAFQEQWSAGEALSLDQAESLALSIIV